MSRPAPSLYIRLVVLHPCLVLSLSLLLLLPTAFFGVLNFTLSDPEGGQLVRDSVEAEQAHAFQEAAEAAGSGFAAEVYEPQQTNEEPALKIYYTAGSTPQEDDALSANVLTVANIQKMAKLEDELVGLSDGAAWQDVCLRQRGQLTCAPLRSAIPYLRHATDESSLRAAIDNLYRVADGSTASPLGGTKADWFFEQSRHRPSRYEAYLLRSEMLLGMPVATGSWYENGNGTVFLNADDRKPAQRRRLLSRFLRPAQARLRATAAAWQSEGQPLSLLFAQSWLYNEEYTGIIISDLMFTVGSIGCVYAVLWAYTSSALLSLLGLLQILLAFPVTLFIYAVVLRIKLFGVLQAMAIFVILGIGADDVLILTGALLLEEDTSRPAVERFASAFRSAFSAMLTTSVTTAAAFGMTAIIKIPTVRYFAVFCSLMVAVNFVLVCSLFLAALVLWDRHLRFGCCVRDSGGAGGGDGGDGGDVIKTDASEPAAEPSDESERTAGSGSGGGEGHSRSPQRGVSAIHLCLQAFATAVGHLVIRYRFTTLAAFGGVAAVMVGFASTLPDPNVQLANPYWERAHPLGRRWDLEGFKLRNVSDSRGIDVRIVVGIETIDRTGTDPTDDADLGVPVYTPTFNFGDPSAQEYMLWLCEEIEANAALLSLSKLDCFSRELRAWRLGRGELWPVPSGHFDTVAREFLRRRAARNVRTQLGFVIDGARLRLRFAHLHATTSVHPASLYSDRYALKQRWLDFAAGLDAKRAPPPSIGATGPFLVSTSFLYVSTIAQAKSTAWTSVGASIALAFCVLVGFTRDLRISVLATLVIGCVVVTVVGLVHIYGWKMDTFEAVCITILVGFSVDYIVHLAVAYVDHRDIPPADREARTLRAMSTLGISVTAGAASTAGACLFLFPATITFLPKFGAFMVTAVSVAFLFSMGAFSALLVTFGPTGGGDRSGDGGKDTLTSMDGLALASASTTSSLPDNIGSGGGGDGGGGDGRGGDGGGGGSTGGGGRGGKAGGDLRVPAWCTGAFAALMFGLLGGAVALQYIPQVPPASNRSSFNDSYRMPSFDELSAGDWEEMRPGGSTVCSRGTPFVFFVRRGRKDKVVLEFMGGGACWSVATCGLRQSTFNERVDSLRPLFAASGASSSSLSSSSSSLSSLSSPPPTAPLGETDNLREAGLADKSGGYADWTHIYVPYCTGDLHWGNASVEYMPGVTIQHRGAVNAQSAVEWLKKHLPSPETLLVTGCSAGAYGSLMWAAKLAPIYVPRGTQLVQLGDSGMGIVTSEFIRDAYPSWNTAAAFPWDIVPTQKQGNRSNADFAKSNLGMADFYAFAAKAYPSARWSQYSAAYDENQAFFYEAMHDDETGRGEPSVAAKYRWNERMRATYNATELLSLPNYAHWIGGGDEHCVVPYNRYWWKSSMDEWSSGEETRAGGGSQAAGSTLDGWVQQMLRGETARPVDCIDGALDACKLGFDDSAV